MVVESISFSSVVRVSTPGEGSRLAWAYACGLSFGGQTVVPMRQDEAFGWAGGPDSKTLHPVGLSRFRDMS